MTQEELKEQIQIDLCTFLEIRGIEDNEVLDQVCQIVVDKLMTQEELKEQIQIDVCTFLEIQGIEDHEVLDQVCQIIVDNFKRAS